MEFRYLYKTLERHLKKKTYTIINGARQVGKTSLLKQLYSHLLDGGEDVVIINLEDKSILASLNENPNNVFAWSTQVPTKILDGKVKKRIFLLIDEVQYLDDPSNFLKYLYDEYEYNVKIIATGSSAFYIDKKFKDSLAGRKRIFNLHPLSFNEFLVFKKQEKIDKEITYMLQEPSYNTQYSTNIKALVKEFLTYGGYPAVVLEEDQREKSWILKELVNSYLRRELIESGVDKEMKFMNLVKILAEQAGGLVNKNDLSSLIGVDSKTIDKYIYILSKSFHIDLVLPYHGKLRKELIKMPKIYFNDVGLRNAVINRIEPPIDRPDKGILVENFIYNQLRIKHEADQIKFWRTTDGNEIDFLIEESFNKGYALEVKWNCNNYRANKYKKFKATYPNFPLSCIDVDNIEILSY